MQINSFLKKFVTNSCDFNLGVDIINDHMMSSQPFMIARFGSTEIKGLLLPKMPYLLNMTLKQSILKQMSINAGFFPSTIQNLKKFSELMEDDIKDLDILGSWRVEELLLSKKLQHCKRLPLTCLEPYLSTRPWTTHLEGKRVLVVHPFSESIERQYLLNRENLFQDLNVLPKFQSLRTVKAVQTLANTKVEFVNWFEALASMKVEINKYDFDVAIIGCGAYGFPLAAYIKRLGKKAIHLGGATQILFGIKGKRWDDNPQISKLYNKYWVRPTINETPSGASSIEGGCYW